MGKIREKSESWLGYEQPDQAKAGGTDFRLLYPAVTCVIQGCKTVEQVESNALAADLPDISDDHPQVV
ncbi:MAG: hypothetical protein KAV87_53845 [Desulfobacteraceae bacterium]|nr:hypothetical protein [Desulfobacteraceae bacterium]